MFSEKSFLSRKKRRKRNILVSEPFLPSSDNIYYKKMKKIVANISPALNSIFVFIFEKKIHF